MVFPPANINTNLESNSPYNPKFFNKSSLVVLNGFKVLNFNFKDNFSEMAKNFIKSIYLLPSNVYSHFPDIKSHILIVLSPLPLIIFSPFNDKQTELTLPLWPF